MYYYSFTINGNILWVQQKKLQKSLLSQRKIMIISFCIGLPGRKAREDIWPGVMVLLYQGLKFLTIFFFQTSLNGHHITM